MPGTPVGGEQGVATGITEHQRQLQPYQDIAVVYARAFGSGREHGRGLPEPRQRSIFKDLVAGTDFDAGQKNPTAIALLASHQQCDP